MLPTIWFRNTWSWGPDTARPELAAGRQTRRAIELTHADRGRYTLHFEGTPELLFTENETNARRIFGIDNAVPFVKDGINDYVVHSAKDAVNPAQRGTKAAGHYTTLVAAGQSTVVRLRLTDGAVSEDPSGLGADFDRIFAARAARSRRVLRDGDSRMRSQPDATQRHAPGARRDALVEAVLPLRRPRLAERRSGQPAPPDRDVTAGTASGHTSTTPTSSRCRTNGSTRGTPRGTLRSTASRSRSSTPNSPRISSILLLREWYMHPNGQLPAYEWALGDVNPPVHAWAAWRVYKIEKRRRGVGDRQFLERVFHKLLINFTWWVNRKDAEGMNVFQGGFLGLDNIGVFDRSATLPTGGHLEQSDGTSWMGMYSLNMLAIAMELAARGLDLRGRRQQILGALPLHRRAR